MLFFVLLQRLEQFLYRVKKTEQSSDIDLKKMPRNRDVVVQIRSDRQENRSAAYTNSALDVRPNGETVRKCKSRVNQIKVDNRL